MDFYFTVSIIAIIILIVALTSIGLLVNYSDQTGKFPPHSLECPDYWQTDASLCIVPVDEISLNAGRQPYANPIGFEYITHNGQKAIDFKNPLWTNDLLPEDVNNNCGLTAWANLNNVLWDGVSNSTACASTINQYSENYTHDSSA
jgi:hypothetical protein